MCVSRWGHQDYVGNIRISSSQQLTCETVNHTCSGQQSTLDDGNGFSPGFDMNGFEFDGAQGPGGTGDGQAGPDYTTTWTLTSPLFGADYYSLPLGLPLQTSDSGNAKDVTSLTSVLAGTKFSLYPEILTGETRAYVGNGPHNGGIYNTRWQMGWGYKNNEATPGDDLGFRCVLEAE